MSNLTSFEFTGEEIFKNQNPVPVVNIRPLINKEKKPIGSSIEVVVPARQYQRLVVKISGVDLYSNYKTNEPLRAVFQNMVVRPYAFLTSQGTISSGWSATAENVEILKGDDSYL